MTITADDLKEEFTDWQGFPPLEADIQYLLFLLKHEVLTAKKFTFPDSFPYCSKDLLFDSFRITEHLKDHKDKTDYILSRVTWFTKRLKGDCLVGPEVSYYGQGGYRSDIGVLAPGRNDYHVILAVEVGVTEWTKIKDCLLHLPHLKEIWHFPDHDDFFIWRRGKNHKLLLKLLEDNKEWLKKLEDGTQNELARRPPWR